MFKPGEYPQPLVRKQDIHFPVVPGYTTARLYTPVVAVSGYDIYQTKALLHNTGDTNVTVTMWGTDNYVSGPRVQIGGAVNLVAAGQKRVEFQPLYQYLEFASPASATNQGRVRATLEGQAEWHVLGFDKTETVYPAALAKKYPDDAPPPS